MSSKSSAVNVLDATGVTLSFAKSITPPPTTTTSSSEIESVTEVC